MGNKAGKAGEDAAAHYLEEKGYVILERNFRSKAGEIDIIARDGESLVFIEVKTWKTIGIDALEQGLNEKKRRRIIETANFFLFFHREYRYMAVRFDVIFISDSGFTHLVSAFTESV